MNILKTLLLCCALAYMFSYQKAWGERNSESCQENNGCLCAELDADGENFYVAYLDKQGVETTYWFKKCMANSLYTFYRVGYRMVSDRKSSDTKGIRTGEGITYINATSSDNIGPMAMHKGGWCGANHHYPDENADSHPIFMTARNKSYSCCADGYDMTVGKKVRCNHIMLEVVNTIFDPAFAPKTGDTILSVPLSTETAVYSIRKNTIEISVRQKISDTTTNTVAHYYCLQSMFENEEYIMTPNGKFTDWTEEKKATDVFPKSAYPLFNRFIECNKTKGTYQGVYLYPNKLGDHALIKPDSWIFNRSYGKCYHHIMNGVENIAGKEFVCNGSYTFFHQPIADNEFFFAYSGILNGKDAVFINAKKTCNMNIALPKDFLFRSIHIVEKSGNLFTDNTFVDVTGVHIIAKSTGSMIFTLE